MIARCELYLNGVPVGTHQFRMSLSTGLAGVGKELNPGIYEWTFVIAANIDFRVRVTFSVD